MCLYYLALVLRVPFFKNESIRDSPSFNSLILQFSFWRLKAHTERQLRQKKYLGLRLNGKTIWRVFSLLPYYLAKKGSASAIERKQCHRKLSEGRVLECDKR